MPEVELLVGPLTGLELRLKLDVCDLDQLVFDSNSSLVIFGENGVSLREDLVNDVSLKQ